MSLVNKLVLVALVAAASVTAAPSASAAQAVPAKKAFAGSKKPTFNGCTYVVNGLGSFTDGFSVDFTTAKSLPANLVASSDTINAGTSPFARTFHPSNVVTNTKNGYLALTVPGGQTQGPISSAEIQTSAKDILYASVRTVAMASNVAGTTHGFSFYSNDTQESDIAFLTYDNTQLHLTNEQTDYGSPVTTFSVAAPTDATTAWHEYRMDWIRGKTLFYIDGKLVYNITQNVPSTPGFLLINNWSNGNAWAKGPPENTNTLKVQSYSAYYNRTSHGINPNSQACKAARSSYNSAVAPKF